MRERLRRTGRTVAAALRRRDGRAAAVLAMAGYLPLYLLSLGHLSFGSRGVVIRVVEDPLLRAVQPVRPFVWEPVGRIVVGPVDLLVAPVNVGLGGVLSLLVALNLAVGVVAWRSPRACGVDRSAGVLAGLPALLSGATCCGPGLLFLVGVQATGALVAGVAYATPVAVGLLVGSLFVVGGRADPPGQDRSATSGGSAVPSSSDER
jgi:hypothetical protein